MADWDDLFTEDAHIIRDADISVIRFARIIGDQGAKLVLDWGSGAGRHAFYLARLGFDVTAMDPSPTGIAEARRWLASEGLEATLRVAKPGRIPAPDSSFDAVLSLYAIEHGTREKVAESVTEIHRVLKPGGLALITFSSGEDSMKQYSRRVAPGTYAPRQGPEAGIPHYLTTREDIDDFFANYYILELSHICSRLGVLAGDDRVDAHWAVLASTLAQG